METQFVAMARTIQFHRVYPDRWGLSLDSFPLKAPNASHSSVFRIWGWTDSHVFVCPIYMSIALLSFEWFLFKHEVGPGKHTQALHAHTFKYTSKHTNLLPCARLAFKNAGINTLWFLRSSWFISLQKYWPQQTTKHLALFFSPSAWTNRDSLLYKIAWKHRCSHDGCILLSTPFCCGRRETLPLSCHTLLLVGLSAV